MRNGMKERLMIMTPVVAVGFSWCMNQYILMILSMLAIFFAISVCGSCKNHENLWLFVLAGAALIPTNIRLSLYASDYFGYLWNDASIMKFIYIPLAFSILLSIEEIILGVIGRIVWKEQATAFE